MYASSAVCIRALDIVLEASTPSSFLFKKQLLIAVGFDRNGGTWPRKHIQTMVARTASGKLESLIKRIYESFFRSQGLLERTLYHVSGRLKVGQALRNVTNFLCCSKKLVMSSRSL